jgi:hypothetical protein
MAREVLAQRRPYPAVVAILFSRTQNQRDSRVRTALRGQIQGPGKDIFPMFEPDLFRHSIARVSLLFGPICKIRPDNNGNNRRNRQETRQGQSKVCSFAHVILQGRG